MNIENITNFNPSTVLDFWFSPESQSKWFVKSEAFDLEIKERFQVYLDMASQGNLKDWLNSANGALALIIVLDQFSRNIYRNSPKAFATDDLALQYAEKTIERGLDIELQNPRLAFLYMPFMHSESLDKQNQSVSLFSKPGLEQNHSFAITHRDIIKRFGRFPHRNQLLGRESTQEEDDFLKNEHSGF